MSKFEEYKKNLPSIFRAALSNPQSPLRHLLESWTFSEDELAIQLNNAKDQIFVKHASGGFLLRLASNLGISSNEFQLGDSQLRQLIPNLSLKPKQIKKAFYDTMAIFWSPLITNANISASNVKDTYTLYSDTVYTFSLQVDSRPIQNVGFSGKSIKPEIEEDSKEVTFEEIINFLQLTHVTSTFTRTGSGNSLNLRTNTPGISGSIEILNSRGTDGGSRSDKYVSLALLLALEQNVKKVLLDQPLRAVLYNVREKELIIELPVINPILTNALVGSTHFHPVETNPIIDPNWPSSYIYNLDMNPLKESTKKYTVLAETATLETDIKKGDIFTQIKLSRILDQNGEELEYIPNKAGNIIIDWTENGEEQPIPYLLREADNLRLQPGYIFKKDHPKGTQIRLLSENLSTTFQTRVDGKDYGAFMSSLIGDRDTIGNILKSLAAAGVVIKIELLIPEIKYLCENPFATKVV